MFDWLFALIGELPLLLQILVVIVAIYAGFMLIGFVFRTTIFGTGWLLGVIAGGLLLALQLAGEGLMTAVTTFWSRSRGRPLEEIDSDFVREAKRSGQPEYAPLPDFTDKDITGRH